MSSRYRLYETADLVNVRNVTYSSMLFCDRNDFDMLAAHDRRVLKRIDRELRRRERHESATPGGNA